MEKYQLTPAEVEYLRGRGHDVAAIEGAVIRVYSYEDWLDPNGSIAPFKGGEQGRQIEAFYISQMVEEDSSEHEVLHLFILPESEGEKIIEKQGEIFEKQIDYWVQGLVGDFEGKFRVALEKEACVKDKLKMVEDFVSNEESGAIFSFPTKGGFQFVGSMDGFFSKKNDTATWYQRIIVGGEYDVRSFVRSKDEGSDHLPFWLAVHVLYRFKKYLKDKLAGLRATPPPPKAKAAPKKALPAFEDAVKEPERLPDLWARLSEMDNAFVTENGNIIGGKKARKHRAVMALAQTITPLMKEGFGQFETYSMLCKRLVLGESSRPDRLPSKPGYDAIRLTILAAIRAVLK